MSETIEQNERTPNVQEKKIAVLEASIVVDNGPLAYLFDTAKFSHLYRIASAMAAAELLPDHLVGAKRDGKWVNFSPEAIKANCFMIVNQSVRWGLDPFAVAPETYVVGGKLAYQGKLVAAVINAKAGLKGRLDYKFSGAAKTDERTVTVSGTFLGEDDPKTVEVKVKDARTANDLWTKDPDQKLCYNGAIKWARRWCPEIILGTLTDDDLERMTERQYAVDQESPKALFPAKKPQEVGLVIESSPNPKPESEKAQPEVVEPVKEEKPARTPFENPIDEMDALLAENDISQDQFMDWCEAESLTSGGNVSAKVIKMILPDFHEHLKSIKEFIAVVGKK